MGGTDKQFDLQKVKDSVKKKQQKETNMKKPIIIAVILTLTFVAYSAGLIYLGTQYEHGINARVTNEAKALTATVKPSKQ